jgi:hypothetical protein
VELVVRQVVLEMVGLMVREMTMMVMGIAGPQEQAGRVQQGLQWPWSLVKVKVKGPVVMVTLVVKVRMWEMEGWL